MKHLLPLIFTIFSIFSLSAQEVDGFRDITWQMPLDSVIQLYNADDFTLVDTVDGESYYVLANDDMTIGTAKLTSIQYVFDKDQKFSKVVLVGDLENRRAMDFILKSKFGKTLTYVNAHGVRYKEWEVGNVDIIFSTTNDEVYLVEIDYVPVENNFYEINSAVSDF